MLNKFAYIFILTDILKVSCFRFHVSGVGFQVSAMRLAASVQSDRKRNFELM